jgi:hypothetical protein
MWAPCWTNSRLPAFALGARPWCQGPEQQLGGHLVSGLDGCESFAFPSADGSDGQSELKMFLIFDHCWRISMIRFRCFSTGTSYHPPTIHLPFGKSRRQDQRMPWRPPADRWWRYHQLRRCRAAQRFSTISGCQPRRSVPNPTMPNLPGTDGCWVVHTESILINLNHTYTLISFGCDYFDIYNHIYTDIQYITMTLYVWYKITQYDTIKQECEHIFISV